MKAGTGLRVNGLKHEYGGRPVLHDLSLHVEPGEIVGLLGPNGAGKSTTFKIIAGIISPRSGTVEVSETNVAGWPLWKRARIGLGYLPQQPTILRRMSVTENIRMGLKSDSEHLEHEILDRFGLTNLAAQKGQTLSGGERRRVEIARAFGTQPAVLLVDEPFAGLDPLAVSQVAESLQHLANQGIGVLLSDHDVRQTLEVCDRIYILYEGRLLVSGSPHDIINSPIAQERYLGRDFARKNTTLQRQPEEPVRI